MTPQERSNDLKKWLTLYLQDKGVGVWSTPVGFAAIEKAVARYDAIEDMTVHMMLKGWDENAFDEAFSNIMSTYPVCTHNDYVAMNELAVVNSDKSRKQFQSFVGRMTQRQRAATATLVGQNKKLEERYLGYIKDHPKATIQAFIDWYSSPKNHPDKIQTNNLYERIKAIRKSNGLAKKVRQKNS